MKFFKPLIMLLGLFFCFQTAVAGLNPSMIKNDSLVFTNKIIPPSIEDEVRIALSHFPELIDTPIEFKFKPRIKNSFMLAQPKFSGIFNKRKNRS